ncbi:MAG: phage baseplate assembly protein V [Acetobacteraceae bacterium]
MDRFLNAVKAHAVALDQAQAQPRFGVVTSVDPANGTARVLLQPEGVLTGWLPVLSPWTGAGWGMSCPPSSGDQVLVLAQEGDSEHGIVAGRAFSLSQPPPAAPLGEFWLVHASGSFLKLTNDGTIHMNGPVSISGTLVVTGDIHAGGDVVDSHGSLAALRDHYNVHVHTDSHGDITNVPTPQD